MSIETHQLSRHYGATRAVDDVTVAVSDEVQVLCLIGPSGGGKSTFLRLLGGLEVPTSGTVSFDGQPLPSDENSLREHRRGNGFLFQAFNLFPHLSAIGNVMLPLIQVHRWEQERAQARAEETIERFGLAKHRDKMPAQLSGGQQQRIALARSLAHEPDLLLLDEPTSALDPEMKSEVLDLVEELCQQGQRIILSTHEMGFARQSSDQVVFLADGKLIETGPSEAFFEDPESDQVKGFLSKVMRW